jgi:hypothetical protein
MENVQIIKCIFSKEKRPPDFQTTYSFIFFEQSKQLWICHEESSLNSKGKGTIEKKQPKTNEHIQITKCWNMFITKHQPPLLLQPINSLFLAHFEQFKWLECAKKIFR